MCVCVCMCVHTLDRIHKNKHIIIKKKRNSYLYFNVPKVPSPTVYTMTVPVMYNSYTVLYDCVHLHCLLF